MKAVHVIAFVLVVIGALNWGLIGIGGWDVVGLLGSVTSRIIYVLVGLSGLWLIFTHRKECKHCEAKVAPVAPTM